LGWTNGVVNVFGDVPHEVPLRLVTYLVVVESCIPPKFIFTVFSGIVLITCSCSRTRVLQLYARHYYDQSLVTVLQENDTCKQDY